MSDLRLVGAVAIKVRPDTSEFRQETQKGINRELGSTGEKAKGKAKVEVDLDTAKAKQKMRTLEQEMDGKEFKLNVGVDYDSIQRAKDQVDRALKSLKNQIIPFELNKESLAAAKRELNDMSKDAKVDFKFVRDEAGYNAILAKIKKIREQKGLTSTWSFKTDTKSLREAELKAQSALRRLEANKTVTLSYSNTFDGIKQAVGEIDKRLNALRELKLKTKLDAGALAEAKAKLLAALETAPVTIKFNENKESYEKVLSRIKQIQMEKLEKEVTFATDAESLARVAQEMRDKIRALDPLRSNNALVFSAKLSQISLDEAKHKAERLKKDIEEMTASMQVQLAGSALVAAQLRFLGRDRVVNYIARVSASSVAIAEGVLKSLGGINTLSSVGKGIENLFTKFDTLSIKSIALATALGSLANVGVYATTALFRIGEGVFQSLGVLAAAPAVLGAATAGYTIFTAAFNNFFDAFNKDPMIAKSALAALPPLARKTVDSITGLYKGLANPIQERFWERVGSTLADSIEQLYPKLKENLLDSTNAVGDFVAGIGRSMNKLALSPDIDKMFAGFKGFFENLSGASEPFFDGWNKFGIQGSQLLPQFGTWITKLAVSFDGWATKLSANGGINDMIMQGVHSLQAMWKIGGEVGGIFSAISRAAGLAGTGGLAQFEINLSRLSDRMNSEPWQSKAATIFEGSRAGASALNSGFKDLTSSLGDSAVWLGNVLDLLGQIGGESISRLSDVVSGKTYQEGVTAELVGMKTLIDGLSPSFVSLGDVIGNMGKVAGTVLSGFAPIVNQLMGLLDQVTTTLSDNLADVAPKMLATVGGVLRAVTPLVLGVTNAINGLLGIIGKVPDSFVLMGVAAAAFFALRGLASKFYESLAGKSYFKNLEGNWLRQQAEAGKTATEFRRVNGEMQKIVVPTERYSVMNSALRDMRSRTGELTGSIRDMNAAMRIDGASPLRANLETTRGVLTNGIGKAASGFMSLMGGPWGLVLASAGLAVGAFAQSQTDAKAHVDDLTASIDRQSGQLNQAGLEKIAKSWTDIGKAGDGFANLFRGAKAANETASLLKLNLADVTRTIAEGGPKSDQLGNNLTTLGQTMRRIADADATALSLGFESMKADADAAAGAFGLTYDELSKMGVGAADIEHLAENIQKEATAAALAKKVFEGLGEATGQSSIQAQQMAGAMQTIGDNSITAASKIGAINKALDLLKGGKLSAREAEVAAQSSFQAAISQAAALKEQLAGNNHLINQTTGLIDVTSESGLKLQQTMNTAANDIKVAAMAAYQAAKDAGKSPEEAMAASQAVITAHKDDLKAIADAAGVDVKSIQKEWDGFFGKTWELNAVFSASADKFQAARLEVEASGLEFNEQVFTALLQAHGDPAKWTMDQATQYGKDYANGVYEAQLKAINPDALQKILEATGQADAYKRGDYTAVMKALNSTDPGVQAALAALFAVKNGDYAAAIKAFLDAISKANTEAALAQLARTRSVNMAVTYTATNSPRPAMIDQANGAFYKRAQTMSDLLSSQFHGRVRAFANGGIENHVAQIARPSSVYRVWAEPETGGEAYIPLAASKRSRSTQILEQVAQQFGYSLTKAQAFKDGGVVAGGNSKAAGLQVHIGTFNQNAQDTIEDVGRGIMRQARNAGVTGIMDGI